MSLNGVQMSAVKISLGSKQIGEDLRNGKKYTILQFQDRITRAGSTNMTMKEADADKKKDHKVSKDEGKDDGMGDDGVKMPLESFNAKAGAK